MQTKQQLIIDKYVAKPIAYLMNFLVRLLGKILSIDHSLDRDFRRIVICKFKGLGSIIQATPMMAALRQKYPNAEIIFVTTQGNIHLLRKIDIIDRVITINDKSVWHLIRSLSRAQWTLIRMRPDVYIDLEIYSNFSTLVTLFSLSKNRIGFYLRSSSFRMGIYTHMMFFNSKVFISEAYMQMARLFGEVGPPIGLYPLYKHLAPEAFSRIPTEPYLIINPNASDLRIERRWAADNFAQLIQQCVARYPGKEILLIGSAAEREYTQEVVRNISDPQVQNLAGKTSIDELIALIRHAELMITNDTGPMHIAFACQTPTVCLFGPCSPEQYGWVNNARVIYKQVYCSPCVHDFSTPPCKGNNTCMQLISVAEVMQVVTDYLDHAAPLGMSTAVHSTFYQIDQEVLGLVNRADLRNGNG